MATIQDTVKTDAAKVEAAASAEAKSFFAKPTTYKVTAIWAAAAFLVGVLVHLL